MFEAENQYFQLSLFTMLKISLVKVSNYTLGRSTQKNQKLNKCSSEELRRQKDLFDSYSIILPIQMGCLLTQKKTEDKRNPQDFRIICNKCLKIDNILLSTPKKKYHPVFEQITKDIDRTFPGHPFFSDPKNKQLFQKLLRRFSLEFPKVGYTQGVNFLAGYLLVSGFGEFQALKCLIAICIHPELMVIGLYQDSFPLCRLYCSLFWTLTKKVCPQSFQAIKSANLPDQLWIFQWFLTFFIYSFPLSYIPKFLNFIIIKKQFSIVRLAVAVVQCLEKYINGIGKREDGFLQCFELMRTEQFCRKFIPIEDLIKKAEKIKKELIYSSLQQCKENTWYKRYFMASTTQRHQLYSKYLQDLNLQRQEFAAQAEMSLRYTRLQSSMNIIDEIEESIVKLYQKSSYRSSGEVNAVFFSRLSMKRYNSLAVDEKKMK